MLQGTVPFKASSLDDLHALIMKGNFKYPVNISPEAKELIESMLIIEPEMRISIPQILRHPWLKTQDELACEEEDDEHDFQVGIEFRREECNFNPLSMLANGGATGLESNRGGRDHDLPSHRDGGESRRETDVEVLLT